MRLVLLAGFLISLLGMPIKDKAVGTFEGTYWGRDLILTLNHDMCCKISWARRDYTGTWTIEGKDIVLHLDPLPMPERLGSYTFGEEVRGIKYINKNKLRFHYHKYQYRNSLYRHIHRNFLHRRGEYAPPPAQQSQSEEPAGQDRKDQP